jgi:hypothetical protein
MVRWWCSISPAIFHEISGQFSADPEAQGKIISAPSDIPTIKAKDRAEGATPVFHGGGSGWRGKDVL